MARIRTIKPEFFLHEELTELSPLHRLLFIGLWCLADRRGRLEDRPKRIKIEILPWDDCDASSLLHDLHERGFIRRYQVGELKLIQIISFEKHQRISGKEAQAETVLPAPPDSLDEPKPEKQEGSNGEAPWKHPRSQEWSTEYGVQEGNGVREGSTEHARAPEAPPPAVVFEGDKPHAEAHRLSVLLADLIAANGSKRPAVTLHWDDQMTLLLAVDGRSVLDVEGAIRFAQGDEFWRGRVLTPEKLRKHFDTMRLQAQGRDSPKKSRAQSRFDAEMAAFLAEEDAS